jgi:hypothetical protein
MTARWRSWRAPATSGSLTESRRSSTRSASLIASRLFLSSAVVGAVTVTHRLGIIFANNKKSLFNRGAEEAWSLTVAVANQAKAVASSERLE